MLPMPSRADLVVLVTLSGGAAFCWAMAIWGGWSEAMYERTKGKGVAWYWLRVFRVPQTRENCIRFIKLVSASGMALLLVGWAFILITS